MEASIDRRSEFDELLRPTKPAWIGLGLVELIAAFLALAVPAITNVPIPELVALLLAACGIARLLHAYRLRRWNAFFGDLLIGVFNVASAVAILAHPYVGVTELSTIVGAWCLAVGAEGAATALRPPRVPSWEWLVGSGFASVLLGMAVLAGWSETVLQTIALVVAANLLINGASTFLVGVSIRGPAAFVEPPAAPA
jgi:uncharacterized membrane protein HdeD (DUF308 family)